MILGNVGRLLVFSMRFEKREKREDGDQSFALQFDKDGLFNYYIDAPHWLAICN